ncbi:MAG: PepSY domain-containing protein [Rhodocyclaceae bacterium]|jgi:hypothetical protein|nr:PepSY domain-containing protein [Rhodocyclaceae bacterium]
MGNRRTGRKGRRLLAALGAVWLAWGSGVWAGDEDHDHDRARQALEAGEVLPLQTILQGVERQYPGQVVDVELEREHEGRFDGWIYKIKVLRPGGALVKLKVDARDGAILGSKGPGGREGAAHPGKIRSEGGGR